MYVKNQSFLWQTMNSKTFEDCTPLDRPPKYFYFIKKIKLLLGHNLVGSFEGYKSGHTVNNALLRELLARPETWEVITYDDPENSPITYLDPIIDPSSG